MLEIASISNEESDYNFFENDHIFSKDDLLYYYWFFSSVNISSFIFLSDPDHLIDFKTFLSDSKNVSSDKTKENLNITGQLIKPIEITINKKGFLAIKKRIKTDIPLKMSENYEFESIKSFKEYAITDRYAQLGMYLHFASDIVLN